MTRGASIALKAIAWLAPAVLVALPAPRSPAAAAPAAPPWQVSLADSSEPGKPFVIEGRVFSLPDSQPVRDVTVHVWHADAAGDYAIPAGKGRFAKLEGKARTNAAGGFRVLTVLPGIAEGAAHVHFALSGTGLAPASMALNLARSHGAGSDTVYARVPYMLKPTASQHWLFVEPDEQGFHASCRLYVRRNESR